MRLVSITLTGYGKEVVKRHDLPYRVFDDSRREGIPAAFRLFEVIDGWQIALSQMRPGDRWTIYIPAALAYGSRTDGDIPGNSTLIFDVELLSIA